MARFDEDTDDDYEHFSCDNCHYGSVRLNDDKTAWECNSCTFKEKVVIEKDSRDKTFATFQG